MIYTKNEFLCNINWYYRNNVYHIGQFHEMMKMDLQIEVLEGNIWGTRLTLICAVFPPVIQIWITECTLIYLIGNSNVSSQSPELLCSAAMVIRTLKLFSFQCVLLLRPLLGSRIHQIREDISHSDPLTLRSELRFH